VGNPQVGDVLAYELYFGDGTSSVDPNSTHAYSPTGTYTASLVVTGSNGCQDSLALPVLVPVTPQTNIIIDDGCGEIEFTAELNSGNLTIDAVLWEVDGLISSNQLSFSQNISIEGNFDGTLTLYGSNDCVYEYPFDFTVIPSITLDELVIPNVITANNDGINDEIQIDTLFAVCSEYKMDILNRWGIPVFSMSNNSDPFRGDDKKGKELLPGVYFYVIRTDQGEKHGNITVVRD
jgi:gliding motility-associated-like protein